MVNFVNNTSQATFVDELNIYSTEEWLRVCSSEFGWFVSSEFIIPIVFKKKLLMTYGYFTSQTIYRNSYSSAVGERKFLNELINLLKQMRVDFIIEPPSNVVFSSYPDGAVHAPFGTYRLDLSLDKEQLFGALHSKHRNVIRKAINDGLRIEIGEHLLGATHALIAQTMERQNKGAPDYDYYTKRRKILGERFEFFAVFKDEIIQGVAVILWNEKGAFYLHGGSTPNPNPGALNFLHWEIICLMKDKGVSVYDFVGARINPEPGSKYESIQRFKARFGGELAIGYTWRIKISHVKYYFFRFITRVFSFYRYGIFRTDIIDQENARLKRLGHK